MAGTIKRWLVWLLSGVLALSLATGLALAGTSKSNGDNRLNNDGTNNKSGVWHKKDAGCGTDYELVNDGRYNAGYDVNADGYVCWKQLDGVYYWVDNTAT